LDVQAPLGGALPLPGRQPNFSSEDDYGQTTTVACVTANTKQVFKTFDFSLLTKFNS